MNSGRLQPALLGGLFIGVLSALPIISAGNCCCCLWVLAGGVLAVHLRQQNLPHQITAGEGAVMGLLAGAIGAVIGTLISIPVQMLMGPIMQDWMNQAMATNQDMPPEFRDALTRLTAMTGFAVVTAVFSLFVYTLFGMLGGLLGVAIFKKNAPPAPPPMPPMPPTIIPHGPQP